ncbi:hypothetical protein BOTBODRAFT_182533 [Botryobasidium botryosum FD-172 SS1]|uniref:Uncharacterized protein n=1 Tax=Botryobasidium botryosum (strain FD-172 SS1) TaxID=930990 RepID=A0A067LTD1_BOTB1|nr:hypothetical protein BOTBODRAFT_182533 [Botryobasidium botryosum FD-172 SS1]
MPERGRSASTSVSADMPETATVILPSSFTSEEQRRHGMATLVQHERVLREEDALRILELLRVAIKRYAYGVRQKVSNNAAVGQRAHTRMCTRVAKLYADVNAHAEQYRCVRSALLALGMDDDDGIFQELRQEDLGVSGVLWGKHFLGGGKSKVSWIWRVPQRGGAEADWLKEADKVLWFQCRAQVKRWREETEIIVEELRRCTKFFGAYETAWGKLIERGREMEGRSAFCQKKVNMYRRLKMESERNLRNLDHPYWHGRIG